MKYFQFLSNLADIAPTITTSELNTRTGFDYDNAKIVEFLIVIHYGVGLFFYDSTLSCKWRFRQFGCFGRSQDQLFARLY